MKNLLKTIGPGILFASTAIGVSHLVQSTQAGASFGMNMIWVILLANLFKYPFFEFGSRYANATGTSIIKGYLRLGVPVLIIFFIITLVSMYLVTAAVGYVTTGFMQNLFGISSTIWTVIVLFSICLLILISNNFKILDRLIKIIGIILLSSTLIAFVMVLFNGVQGETPLLGLEHVDKKGFLIFLIPLMGWMPTALDLSTWNSLWTVERIKESGYHPTLKETLFDFNFGYIMSALLAICFLTLGAFVMFGTDLTFSTNGAVFSGEVVQLYTKTFGNWSWIVISASAFSIMFGTCVAVFDGYTRAMTETIQTLFSSQHFVQNTTKVYRVILMLIAFGSFGIIAYYQNDGMGFKKLVILATSISFLLAPFVAIFNLILVSKKYIKKEYTPPSWMIVLSVIGILFLSVFSILYLFQEQLLPYLA